jgi:hypothetical protein
MSLPKIFRLSDVLLHIDDLPWDHQLFLTGDYPWKTTTPAVILPPDADNPYEKTDDDFLAAEDFVYVCDLSEVQDVVADALDQLPGADLADLLKAFNFYYRHQNFIQF